MNSSTHQILAEKLGDLFVHPVIIRAESVANIDVNDLPPEIRLDGVRDKRQLEFAAGRLAARAAIEASGHNPQFPAIGLGRQPLWPEGLTGSLTHTTDVAIAAVAPKDAYTGLGIDIEELQVLDDSVTAAILTSTERNQIGDDDAAIMHLFSFKESIFKCVYPQLGEYFDFRDVEVVGSGGDLRARCVDKDHVAAAYVQQIRGDSRRVDNHVVSACWLPAST
jgi:4'-phosphopantetheinyl transferase EntD